MIPLIELENVTVRREERIALDGVTISIAQGEHVAILGPNGCGKSTLIKLISRDLYPVLKPEPWALRIMGRDKWRLFDLRHHLGIVSNDWMQMCTRDYSGYEIALSGFFGSVGIWPHHPVTAEMESKTREVMELLEISHLAARNTNEMSSGEARRILIARALVHNPQALVLDEPTTSLDLRATWELRDVLRKLAAQRHQHPDGDASPAGHHPGDASRGADPRRPRGDGWPQGAGSGSGRAEWTVRRPG